MRGRMTWMFGVAAVLALGAMPAGAASKRKVCKQSCGAAVTSCTTTATAFGYGDLAKGCSQAILKRCRKEGEAVCTGFVPPGCGNGRLDLDEICDGTNLRNATCQSAGFDGGTIACSSGCGLDTSGCTNNPVVDTQTVTLPVGITSLDSMWIDVGATPTQLGVDEGASTGGGDAFDDAWVLQVNGADYPSGTMATRTIVTTKTAIMSTSTNSLTIEEAAVGGVMVSAQLTGFSGSPTLRLLYTLRNPTGADVPVTARILGNFGSDNDTTIGATSSGDTTFDTGDRWLVTSDNGMPNPFDPVNTSVFFGPGATVTPSVATLSTDDFSVDFPVTVPANSSRVLMFFAEMHDVVDQATAAAATFDTNAALGAAGLLEGIPTDTRGQIVNWSLGG